MPDCYRFVSLLLMAWLFCAGHLMAESTARPFQLRLRLTLPADRGQNFGSLFEVVDSDGKTVAGAGFQGVYNTYSRGERYRLHFFVSPQQPHYSVQTLPRVNELTGLYLSECAEQLYARSRVGDQSFHQWDPVTRTWQRAEQVTGYELQLGERRLQVDRQQVHWGVDRVLPPLETPRSMAEHYYAAGHLFLRVISQAAGEPANRLLAIAWTPGEPPAQWESAQGLPLRSDKEFIYAFGQLTDHVLAVSNTGGIYRFHDRRWSVLREPQPGVSYQVYSILNYYDRLLLGHYPSGELIAYDGEHLQPLANWPPSMPGVKRQAREAQSLAIYGGQLFVGVWPWAELWRLDPRERRWHLTQRMFDAPEPTSAVAHPYEAETHATGEVYNLWGQRITSLVPFANKLFVSTSSKGGQPPDRLKFPFLSSAALEQYGRVYELQGAGHLSTMLPTSRPAIELTFTITDKEFFVTADQQELSRGTLPSDFSLEASHTWRTVLGRGIYGASPIHIERRSIDAPSAAVTETDADVDAHSNAAEKTLVDAAHERAPFQGAYVHLPALLPRDASDGDHHQTLDAMLDQFQQQELTAILPYANGSNGQAYFPSQLAASTYYGAGRDPLAYLVTAAAARGIDVYPVLCCLVSGHDHPDGILLQQPTWALRGAGAEPLGYISPGSAAARDWVTQLADEVVSRYQPRGLWLDYLRYPNRPIQWDLASEAEFTTWRAQHPELTLEQASQRFREEQLTRLAQAISRVVRRDRVDRQVAIYTWGPHVAQNHRVAQPWPLWSRDRFIDMVNVSGYCYPDNYGAAYMDVFRDRLVAALRLNQEYLGHADLSFALGIETSHGKIQDRSWIDRYKLEAARVGVNDTAIFTWNTLGKFLPADPPVTEVDHASDTDADASP